MSKQTEKERKADALLEAARAWQAKRGRAVFCPETDVVYDALFEAYPPGFFSHDDDWPEFTTLLSSAALSEVAGMCFDIVDARTGK